MSESIAERLARLREQAKSRDESVSESNNKSSTSSEKRLAALRAKQKSVRQSRRHLRATETGDSISEAASEDDEGVSSEGSEIDEDGNVRLGKNFRVELDDYDGKDLMCRKGLQGHNDFVPLYGSIVTDAQPYTLEPGNRGLEARKRIQILKQKARLEGIVNEDDMKRQTKIRDSDSEDEAGLTAVRHDSDDEGVVLMFDDGFYEPDTLGAEKNIARMEARLMRELEQEVALYEARITCQENAAEWFSQAGSMQVLANPVKNYISQPIDVDPIIADMTHLSRISTATHAPLRHVGITQNNNGLDTAAMDVHIHTVLFDDHPLFIEEDIVAARLRGLYVQYQNKVKMNKRDHQYAQLNSLIGYEKTLVDNDTVEPTRLENLRIQIVDLFSRRLAEDLEVRQLAIEMYQTWQNLKGIRVAQEFASTNMKLVSIPLERSYSNLMLDEQYTDVVGMIQAMKREYSEDNHTMQLRLSRALDIVERYKRSRAINTMASMKKKRSSRKSRSDTGTTTDDYIFKLTRDGSFTKDDEVPLKEQSRRKSIRRENIVVKLYVNDAYVAKTDPSRIMWPSFSCIWSRVFRVKTQERPKSIRLDICSERDLGFLKVLSSVYIPVPASEYTNVMAHAVNQNDSWQQFARKKPIKKSLWFRGDLKKTTLLDMYTQDPDTVLTAYSGVRSLCGQIRSVVNWTSGRDNLQGTQIVLPAYKSSYHEIADGQLLGSYEGALAGGSDKGGGAGVSETALDIDDAIPDFANELDFHRLLERCKDADPNDPRNGALLRILRVMEWSTKRGSLFRNEALSKLALFQGADASQYVESKRVALMKLRHEKPHLFHEPIPSNDEEIRKLEKYQLMLVPEDDVEDQDADAVRSSTRSAAEVLKMQRLQKARVTDFINRIREMQKKGPNKALKHEIPVSRVVKEGSLPVFHLDWDVLTGIFEPRRRLKPHAKNRKAASLGIDNASIFVQVVRGVNVPRRSEKYEDGRRSPLGSPTMRQLRRNDEEDDDDDITPSEHVVSSFVQVRFQGTSRRSSAQYGQSPTWNESIRIPFTPPRKDFSPSNLQSINDSVSFNLFDEIVVDAPAHEIQQEDATFQRREKRFLGSFSIPFSSLYRHKKIEGMFRVSTPVVHVDYESGSSGAANRTGVETHGILREYVASVEQSQASSTYIYVMATLDPVLARENEGVEIFGRGENEQVVRYAKQWLSKAKRRNAFMNDAYLQVFGTNLDGESVFISRYLRPQIPPLSSTGEELLHPGALLRFVSLIPFLDDWQAFVDGGDDVWCTSKDFLEVNAGDWEEHAILLCNFLKWIFRDRSNLEVYLVLGKGIPEGETVYVLLIDTSDYTRILFNASSGLAYMVSDPHCPLREISIVVNERNLWANIQEQRLPSKIRWAFDQANDWMPFWTQRMPRIDLPSVQQEVLKYGKADSRFISYLETEIMEQLQRSIRKWRLKRGTTRFSKVVGRKLRTLLETLEASKIDMASDGDLIAYHMRSIRESVSNSKVSGFPINIPFTEVDAILKEVKNTDIYNRIGDEVSFALAVLVVPYTEQVFSIWVYVVAIETERS